MDDQTLLTQIVQLLEEQNKQFNQKFEQIDKHFEKIEEQILKVNIKIEHDVTRRLDSLNDGYMLNHEKQLALERRVDSLERRLEDLEIKAS